MLQSDGSAKACKSAAQEVKNSVKLQADNQHCAESGHKSGSYGSGPKQSAAVPKGAPGTRGR